MKRRVLVPPPIAEPCPQRWEKMTGDARRRYCEQCQLHVHNLSSLTEAKAAQFLASMQQPACLTYELRTDGSLATASRWAWLSSPLRKVGWRLLTTLAALLPLLASACAPRRTVGRTGEQRRVTMGFVPVAQQERAQPRGRVMPGKVAPPSTPQPARTVGRPLPPPSPAEK